jgi:hypothetical protein
VSSQFDEILTFFFGFGFGAQHCALRRLIAQPFQMRNAPVERLDKWLAD